MKNKKLFAILTLVCFMFTLMPVAAFAAPADFSAEASVFATVNAGEEVEISVPAYGIENKVNAQITLKNAGNTNYANTENMNIYVWAESVAGQASDALVLANADNSTAAFSEMSEDGQTKLPNGVFRVKLGAGVSVAEVDLTFLRAGEYVLKASATAPTSADTTDMVVFNGGQASYKKVTATNPAVDTQTWYINATATNTVAGTGYTTTAVLSDGDESGKETPAMVAKVDANGVKYETVTLELKNAQGADVVGYPVKLDTNSSNIEISTTEAYTNHNGEVEFKVAGMREGVYKVYVTVGDLEVAVTVQVGASIANDIEVIEAPEAPVAKDTTMTEYASLIQFEVTDVNGNVVTGPIGNCTTANPGKNSVQAPFVTILEQPAASKLADHNIWIAPADDHYVLALTAGKAFDVEGTYSVKVILDNGRSAVVTWEVKKFQTPVEIVIDAPETVELGTQATVVLTYVDANGVEKLATKDAELAASGYAIAGLSALSNTTAAATVDVKTDEKYAGSVIKLTAVSERWNLVSVEEIAVAKEATAIAFEDDSLAVNINNKVEWNVVDEDGKAVTLDLTNAAGQLPDVTISYVVLDKPEDAKVSIYDATDITPFDGDGVMALTSNKVGNVTVQAIVKVVLASAGSTDLTAAQTKYYTGTEIFAVGTEGKGDVVVMSIGSNEIVINDAKSTIDAAPIVENNRTFVPFRALAEAFGATVAYDEATQAVTASLNGVEVVMTIGSATYTVNGVEATADVAPFINGSRTMVPVRFVAEAFGIKVIPTYDENGATADILFNL